METFTHDLGHLFDQLGLPSGEADIERFVAEHKLKYDGQALADASFWTPAQAAFLQETIAEDSDWAEATDQLDALLRG